MHQRRNRSAAVFLALCAAVVTLSTSAHFDTAHAADNWPQFRGAESTGVGADGAGLPDRWTTTENVLWKTDLPGRGWSSPIVWDNRVFLTTVVNQGQSEEPKKGLYMGGNRPEPPTTAHDWKVYCLDLDTGEILWERTPFSGVPASAIHLKNSFASETPVTDGKRVYAYFGNKGLVCYDLDGAELWKQEFAPLPTRYGWGTASSPVLYQGRLFIVNDNDQQSYIAAIDAETGQEVWRTERDEKSNWATPYVWENDLRTEIVTPGTGKTRSYDLNGNLLWELEGMSSITIAMPYSRFGLLYLSSGYIMDKKKPIFAVKPGASGNISLAEDQTSNDYIVWSKPGVAPYNPSTLIYGDQLYVLYDRAMMASFDPHTGEMIYERQRLPDVPGCTASPWAYDDKIFCLNEDGVTFVVQAGPEFKVLHRNALAEDDMAMATPAIVGDKLIIRTAARVYCMKQGAKLPEEKPAEAAEAADEAGAKE